MNERVSWLLVILGWFIITSVWFIPWPLSTTVLLIYVIAAVPGFINRNPPTRKET